MLKIHVVGDIHGPPKFILDSVYKFTKDDVKYYEHCGDLYLYHRVKKIRPQLHVFGHIHNSQDNRYPANNGVYFDGYTWYINASCVEDGNMGIISSHGWIVEMEDKQIIKIYRNE